MTDPVPQPCALLRAEKNPYLEFFLAHIDPLYAEDTNADIGVVFVALAYPSILVVGPPLEYERCIVDVGQPGFHAQPDSYPLKPFLEEFPHVCRQVIESHEELSRIYTQWWNF